MTDDWNRLLDGVPLATPELIVRRELRRRTDLKFVMPLPAAAEFVRALGDDYAVLTAGAERFAFYRTLYFDTPDLALFHAHRRGRRVRHKVRIRHYPDRGVAFLEVKTRRSALETTKTWREREHGDSELSQDDQAFVSLHSGNTTQVLPQVWTHFRRLTLLGLHLNERITVDLDLDVAMGSSRRSFASLAIVEVKQWPFYRGSAALSALRAAGWRAGWASKYCTAIASIHPEVRLNQLLPGLRAFERVAA